MLLYLDSRDELKVYDWMFHLGLDVKEIFVLAIIHQEWFGGRSWYERGGVAYIAEWCGCKEEEVVTILGRLEAKDLIVKKQQPNGRVYYSGKNK